MLILAGVSLNAMIGDNGIISNATYSSVLQELIEVQEAVDTWKIAKKRDDLDNEDLPTSKVVQTTDISIDKTGRLYGEIAYYRKWAELGVKPTISIKSSTKDFNNEFSGDLYGSGSKIIDLYYLDMDALDLKTKQRYIVDANTGIIYQEIGSNIQGVNVHSIYMLKSIQNGIENTPLFASVSETTGPAGGEPLANKYSPEYELNEDGSFKTDVNGNKIKNSNYNPNSFKFITSVNTNNIYKLYSDGRLYGKGLKGIGLQTDDEEMEKIDSTVFKELTIPSEIPSCKKIIPSSTSTMYVIDNNDNLWAWGSNNSNKFGLTQIQQNSYTGREAVQING